MKFISKLIALSLTGLFVGCLYLPFEYYLPKGDGIELKRPICGNSGPPDTGTIDVGDVSLHFHMTHSNDLLRFSYTIEISENHSVQIKTKTILINGQSFEMSEPRYYDSKLKEFVTCKAPLVGDGVRISKRYSGYEGPSPKQYYYSVNFPVDKLLYTVELPDLFIDGVLHKIPTITFSYKKGWYVIPLNC